MPTSAFNKFEKFSENTINGVHNWTSDTFKLMLSNTAPNLATNTVKADITEISAGNGYTAGGATVTKAVSRTGGTTKVTITDVTITASGGSIGPWRYGILYDDTPTSPADPLVASFDYGSSVTTPSGQNIVFDFDGTLGAFDIA